MPTPECERRLAASSRRRRGEGKLWRKETRGRSIPGRGAAADGRMSRAGRDVSNPSLTAVDQQLLQKAAELHRPLARASAVARGNALGYAAFGALSLLVALVGLDPLGLAISALVTGVGVVQLRAAPRLRQGDPTAPRVLARNELVLMAGILVYCLLQLTVLRTSGAELQARVGGTGDLGLDLAELTDWMTTTIYSAFLGTTLLYQGGLALYFLRRRPMLERYLAETPAWARSVVESLRV